MTVNPIQVNIDNTKSQKTYRDAKASINTTDNIKPITPQGHLINDRLSSMPKFFVKDFLYDLKAVKDGFKGDANDHQLGRLNDVGLKLGGIGIATMLAARTKNPMGRVMEYLGLGAFLASMSLFPKIAIQAPARARYGFDPGLEYIDDQGRKKSVFQDSNYIPFDMYKGEYPSEDLDIIGDKLGIPRDIKNRHDLVREQMRKIATQNNTLWMLSAGFATPVMTALICCGLEKVVAPIVETGRNLSYNSRIKHALERTAAMAEEEAQVNNLSKNVEKLLSDYKGQELPKNDFDNLVKIFTKELDSKTSDGIKKDLEALFKPEIQIKDNKNLPAEMVKYVKANLSSRNANTLERVFVPTEDEMKKILNTNDIEKIRGNLKNLFAGKIEKEAEVDRKFLKTYQHRVIDKLTTELKGKTVRVVSDDKIKDTVNFAKIIGEFKQNDKVLDKCKNFKVEHFSETVLGRYYTKFEDTLIKSLNISFKEMKQMRESDKIAEEIIDRKISELVKNDAKYEKAISKLAKVMSEAEVALNGKSADSSHLKDLINAIENNYNNTAKRLNKSGKFSHTIEMLVKEDVGSLANSVNSREELFNILDGVAKPVQKEGIEYVKESAKGVGSAKNITVARIIDRYQGATNSEKRILHLLDFYKQAADPKSGLSEDIIKRGKEALLKATSAEHTMKLNTINNPDLYKEIMWKVWSGKTDSLTQKAMQEQDKIENGNIMTRFNKYIKRFRDIIGNNNIDFTKPDHVLDDSLKNYTKSEQTRISKFNLVAQNSVDTFKNAAERRYGNQKWLRKASKIGGVVLGATLLAQVWFGKIRNPHNMQRQVSDDASK